MECCINTPCATMLKSQFCAQFSKEPSCLPKALLKERLLRGYSVNNSSVSWNVVMILLIHYPEQGLA